MHSGDKRGDKRKRNGILIADMALCVASSLRNHEMGNNSGSGNLVEFVRGNRYRTRIQP